MQDQINAPASQEHEFNPSEDDLKVAIKLAMSVGGQEGISINRDTGEHHPIIGLTPKQIVLLIGTITGDEEKSLFATSLMLTEKSESISVDDDHLIIKYQDADCAEKAQATLAVLKGMIKDAQASLVPVH
jgi:hypothetical protein